MHTIVCRAKLGPSCLHGQPTAVMFDEDLEMDEDGTFDGSSLVCDPCYVRCIAASPSGRGLNHELAATIAALKARS